MHNFMSKDNIEQTILQKIQEDPVCKTIVKSALLYDNQKNRRYIQ